MLPKPNPQDHSEGEENPRRIQQPMRQKKRKRPTRSSPGQHVAIWSQLDELWIRRNLSQMRSMRRKTCCPVRMQRLSQLRTYEGASSQISYGGQEKFSRTGVGTDLLSNSRLTWETDFVCELEKEIAWSSRSGHHVARDASQIIFT